MGDPPSSQFMPPPPIPSITRPNFHMMYYGLVVVGTTLVVLALYNLIIVRWSGGYTANQRGPHHRAFSSDVGPTRSRSLSNLNVMNYFVYSFMYKKDEKGNDSECAICLSVFEEGEELRQLPNCMHSFHANCIGMWLYSHMDCPLCRTSVEPPSLGRRVVSEQPEEHSREGLLVALASV